MLSTWYGRKRLYALDSDVLFALCYQPSGDIQSPSAFIIIPRGFISPVLVGAIISVDEPYLLHVIKHINLELWWF